MSNTQALRDCNKQLPACSGPPIPKRSSDSTSKLNQDRWCFASRPSTLVIEMVISSTFVLATRQSRGVSSGDGLLHRAAVAYAVPDVTKHSRNCNDRTITMVRHHQRAPFCLVVANTMLSYCVYGTQTLLLSTHRTDRMGRCCSDYFNKKSNELKVSITLWRFVSRERKSFSALGRTENFEAVYGRNDV